MAKLNGSKELDLLTTKNEDIVEDMNQDLEEFVRLVQTKEVIGYSLTMCYLQDKDTEAISCGFVGPYGAIMQAVYKGMLLMREQYEKDLIPTGTKH